MEQFTAVAKESSYSPFVLNFNRLGVCGEPGRHWSLSFQDKPTREIIFTGDIPTRDEIIECLMGINAPVYMIAICEIAVAEAVTKNATVDNHTLAG